MNKIDSAESSVRDVIQEEFRSLIEGSAAMNSQIDAVISDWREETLHRVYASFPFAGHEKSLNKWQNTVFPDSDKSIYSRFLLEYKEFCSAAKIFIDVEFWEQEFGLITETGKKRGAKWLAPAEIKFARTLLLDEWQKETDHAYVEWELQEIQRLQDEFLKKLRESLGLMKQLFQSLMALGLEPGRWLDLSKGSLTKQQVDLFRRWATYFQEDEGAKQICEILGKMRQIEFTERAEKVKISRTIDTYVPDQNSKEEIIGIRLGRDIEHVLPSELAHLSEPETSLLFDIKYVESRLMCFDMQGLEIVQHQQVDEIDVSSKDAETLGPMVLCIDTSGSMHGTPEAIAKAVTLFMGIKAKEQGRPCYLINFSTDITTLDLTGGEGLDALISFLSMSFHGGTDVAPAFTHALHVMQKDVYEKADLLIVSDFIMADLSSNIQKDVERQKERGNRFYSLVVGNCFMSNRLKTLFDNEWVYNPNSGKLHELVKFGNKTTRN